MQDKMLVDKAAERLQSAIANLIPKTQLNATKPRMRQYRRAETIRKNF